jgi:hypothetical protein
MISVKYFVLQSTGCEGRSNLTYKCHTQRLKPKVSQKPYGTTEVVP